MNGHSDSHQMALPAGYQLDQYRIEAELGHGGFGITYRAVDMRLDRVVAIKEYLPRDLAFRNTGLTDVQAISESNLEVFEWGLECFLDEARTLAKFNHPNIVRVLQFFRANNTAYLVMEYCEGESLDRILKRDFSLPCEKVRSLCDSLLNALDQLHKLDIVHRDIKPANIFIQASGTPVLLDFGSARQALGDQSRSMTSVISPHYAAFEQYSTRGKQGSWTDIYGLAATLYHCITGEKPPEATDRIEGDEIIPASLIGRGSGYSQKFLATLDYALQLLAKDRLQSAKMWRKVESSEPVESADYNYEVTLDAASTVKDSQTIPRSKLNPALIHYGYAVIGILIVVIAGYHIL